MTQGPDAPRETIGFRRSPSTPGVDVLDARNSPREWRIVSHLFCVVVFNSWRGSINLAGRTLHGEPGVVLCNRPHELMVA